MKHAYSKLSLKLHEHGISEHSHKHDHKSVANVGKHKSHSYYGIFLIRNRPKNYFYLPYLFSAIFKFRFEDTEKIFERLISGLTTKVAVLLLPGLPAYIILMCIRWVYV